MWCQLSLATRRGGRVDGGPGPVTKLVTKERKKARFGGESSCIIIIIRNSIKISTQKRLRMNLILKANSIHSLRITSVKFLPPPFCNCNVFWPPFATSTTCTFPPTLVTSLAAGGAVVVEKLFKECERVSVKNNPHLSTTSSLISCKLIVAIARIFIINVGVSPALLVTKISTAAKKGNKKIWSDAS